MDLLMFSTREHHDKSMSTIHVSHGPSKFIRCDKSAAELIEHLEGGHQRIRVCLGSFADFANDSERGAAVQEILSVVQRFNSRIVEVSWLRYSSHNGVPRSFSPDEVVTLVGAANTLHCVGGPMTPEILQKVSDGSKVTELQVSCYGDGDYLVNTSGIQEIFYEISTRFLNLEKLHLNLYAKKETIPCWLQCLAGLRVKSLRCTSLEVNGYDEGCENFWPSLNKMLVMRDKSVELEIALWDSPLLVSKDCLPKQFIENMKMYPPRVFLLEDRDGKLSPKCAMELLLGLGLSMEGPGSFLSIDLPMPTNVNATFLQVLSKTKVQELHLHNPRYHSYRMTDDQRDQILDWYGKNSVCTGFVFCNHNNRFSDFEMLRSNAECAQKLDAICERNDVIGKARSSISEFDSHMKVDPNAILYAGIWPLALRKILDRDAEWTTSPAYLIVQYWAQVISQTIEMRRQRPPA